MAKYQKSSLKLNNHKESPFLEKTIFNNKNIFQSTMLAEATASNSSLDISAIKPKKDGLKIKPAMNHQEKYFKE